MRRESYAHLTLEQKLRLPARARQKALSQWDTEPWAAAAFVRFARIGERESVLEPAAGVGMLIEALSPRHRGRVVAYEVDQRRVDVLGLVADARVDVRCEDFLAASTGIADVALQNPPYEDGLDVAFVNRSLDWAPRAAALLRLSVWVSKSRYRDLWRWVDPRRAGFFSERPDFGGPFGAETDFVALELVRRKRPRRAQETVRVETSWLTKEAA